MVMSFGKTPPNPASPEQTLWPRSGQVDRRQWWLWGWAILVTLLLTAGVASFSYLFDQSDPNFSFSLRQSVRGLVALVFLFDLYTIYQQVQIHRIRRQLNEREELYRLVPVAGPLARAALLRLSPYYRKPQPAGPGNGSTA